MLRRKGGRSVLAFRTGCQCTPQCWALPDFPGPGAGAEKSRVEGPVYDYVPRGPARCFSPSARGDCPALGGLPKRTQSLARLRPTVI